MFILHDYQNNLKQEIFDGWAYHDIGLAVLPTGGGKTVVMSDIIREHIGYACAIAHRQELIGQISKALAANGIFHSIIAPKKVIKEIVRLHTEEFGRPYISSNSKVFVASVDTLIRRGDKYKNWLSQISLWIIDEAHHILKTNKWGKAVQLFPNAKGLGVTGTPQRADGKGLGDHADGVFQFMVVGPHTRELIERRFLSDYKIYTPPTNLDLSSVKISDTTGDYVREQLKKAVQQSNLIQHEGKIVGDVVATYTKIANGRKGVTFATDVETATEISRQFNVAGVPSEVVSAKTPDASRNEIIRRFKNGNLKQLVNVDLFGEGFDLPAIEVVQMARPTKSYSLYIQQIGRALRVMEGKDQALIIDHVGNVFHFAPRHGKPCSRQFWTLDRRDKKRGAKRESNPYRVCSNCTGVFESYSKQCPECGHIEEPAKRSEPQFVDGDLTELDPDVLTLMQQKVDHVDMPEEHYRDYLVVRRVPQKGMNRLMTIHKDRQSTQKILREKIALWAGHGKAAGLEDYQLYRKFYLTFGTDVMTAQTLNKADAESLLELVERDYSDN